MKIIKNTLIVLALTVTTSYAGDILATVNGKKITTDDAQRYLLTANARQPYSTLSEDEKKIITDRLIERVLFIEAAEKSGVAEGEAFKSELEISRNEIMIKHWMKGLYDAAIVSDGEAQEFYKKNIDKYKKPPQVHARHILIKDENASKEIIEELKGLEGDKLKSKFIELAKSKSEGPSGPKGGDLGYFVKGQMVAPFSKAAFDLAKGQYTKAPVKTQFGYHVIYVEDKKDAITVSYEDVKNQVVQNLKQAQFRKMLEKNAKELKSKAKIAIESKK